MERETLNAEQLEELMKKGTITDKEKQDDHNDGPKDGEPALIPPATPELADLPVAEAVENGEAIPEPVKTTEPKFNVTHFGKD